MSCRTIAITRIIVIRRDQLGASSEKKVNMSIAIAEAHRELARIARALLDAKGAKREARALLDAPVDRLPSFWNEMAELGWLGLHVSETHGGQGFTLAELAVVLEV